MDHEFENKCKKVFGCSSKHLLYKLTEMEDRVSVIENFIKENNSLTASIVVRIEALTNTIANVLNYAGFRKAIDKETDTMCVGNKNLIEKK